jgi:S1-C subfamily serine protease
MRQLNVDGVLVMDVPPDSAAGRAGIRGTVAGHDGRWVFGDVIVAIDDEPVHSSSDLFRIVEQHKVGDQVTVTVERGKQRKQVEVSLQALPDPTGH